MVRVCFTVYHAVKLFEFVLLFRISSVKKILRLTNINVYHWTCASLTLVTFEGFNSSFDDVTIVVVPWGVAFLEASK